MKYSLWLVHHGSILLPLLCLTSPTEGFPWHDLREGVCRPVQMAVLPPPPIRSVLQSGYSSWDVKQPLEVPFSSLPSHFLPSSPFPLLSYFFTHSPSPPLEVGLVNITRRFGERYKLPKLNLVYFSLKIWYMVATNVKIFLEIKWPNFKQNF